MKSCVNYLTEEKKIPAPSQTVATARIAPKICQGQLINIITCTRKFSTIIRSDLHCVECTFYDVEFLTD